jgi:hypothetical protein
MYLTAQTAHYCKGVSHKVHIYLEYHGVCPLVRIGTPHRSVLRREILNIYFWSKYVADIIGFH